MGDAPPRPRRGGSTAAAWGLAWLQYSQGGTPGGSRTVFQGTSEQLSTLSGIESPRKYATQYQEEGRDGHVTVTSLRGRAGIFYQNQWVTLGLAVHLVGPAFLLIPALAALIRFLSSLA